MIEKIKKYLLHVVIFVIGIGAGILLCLIPTSMSVGKRDVAIKTDTIYKEVVKAYTPLELKQNTIKLDVPKIKTREYVFLSITDSTIIYRDSIRYVTLPREYFYTKQDDVEIWHSGVDSRIDSLRYKTKETIIKETYKRKDWRNEIRIYGAAGYNQVFNAPVGAEYNFYPQRWIGVGGKIEYDFIQKTHGVYATMNIRFGW